MKLTAVVASFTTTAVTSTALALAPMPAAYAIINECPSESSGGYFLHSGTASPETSCAFAENVRYRYNMQPTRDVPIIIEGFSPVTGQSYPMNCEPGSAEIMDGSWVPSMQCRGGNDAVVDLW